MHKILEKYTLLTGRPAFVLKFWFMVDRPLIPELDCLRRGLLAYGYPPRSLRVILPKPYLVS